MDVIILSLAISFLWALAPIIHKLMFKFGLHPKSAMAFGGVAYAACIAVWGAWNWGEIRRDVPRLKDWRVVGLIMASSVLVAFLGNLLYYRVMKDHMAYIVTALTYSSPIFTLFLAWWLLKEKITWVGVVGVLLIVVGVILVSLQAVQTLKPQEFAMF
jgi:drug/metabolite transporter (DMT)-like permease